MTKKHLGVAAAAVSVALLVASCSAKQAGGEVAAKVNGAPIYATDVALAVTRTQQEAALTGQEPDPAKAAEDRAAALDVLIQNELLFQEAARLGYQADAAGVEETLASIASQFANAGKFDEALAQMGISRDVLRRDLERAESVQKMIEQTIEREVVVKAEEVRAFFDSNPQLFVDPEQVRARHILILLGEDATEAARAEARRTLEGLQRRARQGESFEALAQKYSQDPSASEGGDLGYFYRGQMVGPFEEAAFALKVGEVSDVVATPFGLHLIQLVDRKPEGQLPFDRVEVSLTQYLHRQRVDEAVDALVRQLRDKAKIKIYQKKA